MLSEKLMHIISKLPSKLAAELIRTADAHTNFERRLSEIRIRAARCTSLTLDGKNIPLGVKVSQEELADTVSRFCRGSVYAYSESLREGYINLGGGFRAGVAGRAVMEDGVLEGVGDISSICIRVSHNVPARSLALDTFKKMGCSKGMLVYSPPGGGKTTLLRDLAVQLSSGPDARRVAIIDSRGELDGDCMGGACLVDVLIGYPKSEGIEIATRTLSPEVIVCDEIGGYDECESILAVQSCGVPIIASAHGSSLPGILARSSIKLLAGCGIFGAYVGISHARGGMYSYTVDYSE